MNGKDAAIERRFREYFAGAEAPGIDLKEAKAELVRARRRAAKRRALTLSLSSVCACLALVLVFVFALMPAPVMRYALASADTETVAYSELKERFADEARTFAPFSLSSNATAEYTVYSTEGQPVLLEARLGISDGLGRVKAVVRVDLTEGKYLAEELEPYKALGKRGEDYRFETLYINGEYVSRAYVVREGGNCFVDVESAREGALGFILAVL